MNLFVFVAPGVPKSYADFERAVARVMIYTGLTRLGAKRLLASITTTTVLRPLQAADQIERLIAQNECLMQLDGES